MASFTQTGFTAGRTWMPSMQAQVFAPPPLPPTSRNMPIAFRDGDMLWSDTEICNAKDRLVCARGTVAYRIVSAE